MPPRGRPATAPASGSNAQAQQPSPASTDVLGPTRPRSGVTVAQTVSGSPQQRHPPASLSSQPIPPRCQSGSTAGSSSVAPLRSLRLEPGRKSSRVGSDRIHLRDRVHHFAGIFSEILQKTPDHPLFSNRQPSQGSQLNRILCHRGSNPLCIPSVIRVLKLIYAIRWELYPW